MTLEDNPRVRDYLKAVSAPIRWRRAREQARRELLGHLEDSIAAKLAKGMSESESIAQALAELGPAQAVGIGLNRVHRPVLLAWPFLAAIAASVAIVGALLLAHLGNRAVETYRAREAAVIARHFNAFEGDQARLAGESVFRSGPLTADAGAFLNSRVVWTGQGALYDAMNAHPTLRAPEEIKRKLHHYKSYRDAFAHAREIDAKGVDLAWLKALRVYDYWDFFATGPLAESLKTHGDQAGWPWMPIPNFAELRDLAELRMVAGFRQHRLLPALREVRQLARLCYTNESLIGAMVSVALLRMEADAFEEGRKEGLISAAEWRPFSAEELVRARRTLYGVVQFFSPTVDPALVSRLFLGAKAPVGYCTALGEGGALAAFSRMALAGRTALDTDFEPQFALLDEALRRSEGRCRLTYVRQTWEHPESTRTWLARDDAPLSWKLVGRYFSAVPGLRNLILFRLLETSVADYMNQYEKQPLEGD